MNLVVKYHYNARKFHAVKKHWVKMLSEEAKKGTNLHAGVHFNDTFMKTYHIKATFM